MGTRTLVNGNNFISRDHPHAYGDKAHTVATAPALIGSSPRVWGQAKNHRPKTRSTRIIPTRMGTRMVFNMFRANYEDHPHAYGDKEKLWQI